jgi:hypothetical protein
MSVIAAVVSKLHIVKIMVAMECKLYGRKTVIYSHV